jgi:hypothetical protein
MQMSNNAKDWIIQLSCYGYLAHPLGKNCLKIEEAYGFSRLKDAREIAVPDSIIFRRCNPAGKIYGPINSNAEMYHAKFRLLVPR